MDYKKSVKIASISRDVSSLSLNVLMKGDSTMLDGRQTVPTVHDSLREEELANIYPAGFLEQLQLMSSCAVYV